MLRKNDLLGNCSNVLEIDTCIYFAVSISCFFILFLKVYYAQTKRIKTDFLGKDLTTCGKIVASRNSAATAWLNGQWWSLAWASRAVARGPPLDFTRYRAPPKKIRSVTYVPQIFVAHLRVLQNLYLYQH